MTEYTVVYISQINFALFRLPAAAARKKLKSDSLFLMSGLVPRKGEQNNF
jgi:hypothetical protein